MNNKRIIVLRNYLYQTLNIILSIKLTLICKCDSSVRNGVSRVSVMLIARAIAIAAILVPFYASASPLNMVGTGDGVDMLTSLAADFNARQVGVVGGYTSQHRIRRWHRCNWLGKGAARPHRETAQGHRNRTRYQGRADRKVAVGDLRAEGSRSNGPDCAAAGRHLQRRDPELEGGRRPRSRDQGRPQGRSGQHVAGASPVRCPAGRNSSSPSVPSWR